MPPRFSILPVQLSAAVSWTGLQGPMSSPMLPVSGSLRAAPPFPRSGPSESGSPTSQVVLRCYDFPPTHPRSLVRPHGARAPMSRGDVTRAPRFSTICLGLIDALLDPVATTRFQANTLEDLHGTLRKSELSFFSVRTSFGSLKALVHLPSGLTTNGAGAAMVMWSRIPIDPV